MVNIAEILKDAPSGTKLYSPIYGECELKRVDIDYSRYPICVKAINGCGDYCFTKEGKFVEGYEGGECLLFPSKENRDWMTFKVKRVFHKGDFVYRKLNDGNGWISIQDLIVGGNILTFADVMANGEYGGVNTPSWPLCLSSEVVEERLATEGEKALLLKKIDEIGYVWNENTLEMNPKEFYSFKAFDKVLVRDSDDDVWLGSLFSFVDNKSQSKFVCVNGNGYKQCIPYEFNECLLGTRVNP